MTAPSAADRPCPRAGSRRTASCGAHGPYVLGRGRAHSGRRRLADRRRARHRPRRLLCGGRRRHPRNHCAARHDGPRHGRRRTGPRRQGLLIRASRLRKWAIQWRHAVPRDDPTTRLGRRVWPRRVRRPAAAAVCDGARSSNDYSSGRRRYPRLETAAGFRSPRSTYEAVLALIRTTPGTTTPTGVTWFPAVCMAHRLRTVKTLLAQKFTPNQASYFLRIGDVTPFTDSPLVSTGGPFYRLDVSSRYISSA